MIGFPEIEKACEQIIDKFQPDKVILFGSYAYGEPGEDSDVDLLVIMPVEPDNRMALEIRKAIDHPFSLDLLVRDPQEVEWRYRGYDPLIRYALDEGKVLYDRFTRNGPGTPTDHPRMA
jgi:predicted nucleotidyltransferase